MPYILVSALICWLCLGGAGNAAAPAGGQWLAGDFHTHSYLSDGSHTLEEVASQAFLRFGLDWLANSEHGGQSARDPQGRKLPEPLWRWFTLQDYAYPRVKNLRARYPGKLVLLGLEWNVPGHEHASVGLTADEPQAISDFAYLFDEKEQDASRGPVLVKQSQGHAGALAAVRWLKKHYPRQSYVVFNHPSRQLKYTVADLRDFHDAAPEICFGLEGLPGHQKMDARGGYKRDFGAETGKARTYGGADWLAAKVGGLWDALLGEGRRFFIFANSDFHNPKVDFWPGEYSKSVVFAETRTNQGLLQGFRSGRSFVVLGDLITALEFWAEAGTQRATMGQTLKVGRGGEVRLTIRFRSPARNHNQDAVRVHHVDLIAGDVTGRVQPGTPAYREDKNPTTRMLARFDRTKWQSRNGWQEIVYRVKGSTQDKYFRLRGTNLAPGVENETDQEGNPLRDKLNAPNTAAQAWRDLWFYSNPIFVQVR